MMKTMWTQFLLAHFLLLNSFTFAEHRDKENNEVHDDVIEPPSIIQREIELPLPTLKPHRGAPSPRGAQRRTDCRGSQPYPSDKENNEVHDDVIEPPSIIQREIELPLPTLKPHRGAPSPRGAQRRTDCRGSQPCPRTERHSHGPWHHLEVHFPLARPSAANIRDICFHLGHRTTYGREDLPSTGFSHLHRRGSTINRMEAGFAKCCQKQSEADKLDCTLTVWEHELNQFCEEEFSIKTKHHACCKERADRRYDCFARDVLHHSYRGAGPSGRKRNNSVAHSHTAAVEMRLLDIVFPPAEPNRHNIHNICQLRKIRPRYPPKSLPQSGYGTLTRQARALQQLEIGYTKCCKHDDKLTCAHKQWKEALSQYCEDELSVRTQYNRCCLMHHHKRYVCFRDNAPFPNYDRERRNISLTDVTEGTMQTLCQKPFKLLTKMPVAALVRGLQKNCCPIDALEERVHCGNAEKRSFSAHMCGLALGSWRDRLKCCKRDTETCFDSAYLSNVWVATTYEY
ncbi:extracellular matrix protein 1-like isoform X2 [Carcharodon carcharias]|uniref:extracellular matrix protein 1-like isoform X2 n=1 Tax=Carcharodon carcharias TaxID=13397 RepID=UPI001B7F5179|nr:extracellular matrix protein 1-like isoform X2 [Carcharodon carcharias]